MQKDDSVYVGHMLDAARKAVDWGRRTTRAEYDANEHLRLALTHLVQTIGEAARHVSDPFRTANPAVPWAKVIAMRHKVVHDYLDVDYDIVWTVVSEELPALIPGLERIGPQEPPGKPPVSR